MRFAFALLGSRGDVQPALAVALELRGRGHEVEVAVAPNLVEFVARLGITAVPVGGDSRDLLGSGLVREDMRSRVPARRLRALRAVASVGWDDLRVGLVPLAARADVVVTGLLGQEVGSAVAEAHDVRFAALHFCPVRANPVVPIVDLPAVWPDRLARPVQAGAWRAGEAARWHLTRRAENEQRARLGLAEARVGLPERLRDRGALEVQAYDPALVPGLADAWPARRPVVGFLDLGAEERRRLADTDVAEDPALEDWLAAGPPPVYVGFGSMAVGDPRRLVATVGRASAALGVRVVLSTGWNDFPPGLDAAHPHVRIVGPADHATLLPRCRAAVHHGGAGTTAAALRAGLPAVVGWFSADQPIWARLLRDLGVGVGVRFRDLDATTLAAALAQVLDSGCAARARHLAARLVDPGTAVAGAADLLERAD
ncbi:glycosyltransferase [Nocardioides sp. dk4132]|uniref:glycosyltransferase n=1 Tax=unclassified Nocardioides TaxID=2615069 RepID=UPI00129822CE|nr:MULTISPECIES: nucleotide disphospho-sugar-binding domain-containing protein [unclassified Nocardioides]MQW75114.1 glycosyltransferase [Nocardioides sp. dk4132]QGA07720.1 glycosyltransferase [Nocardioides sp. dk884]